MESESKSTMMMVTSLTCKLIVVAEIDGDEVDVEIDDNFTHVSWSSIIGYTFAGMIGGISTIAGPAWNASK